MICFRPRHRAVASVQISLASFLTPDQFVVRLHYVFLFCYCCFAPDSRFTRQQQTCSTDRPIARTFPLGVCIVSKQQSIDTQLAIGFATRSRSVCVTRFLYQSACYVVTCRWLGYLLYFKYNRTLGESHFLRPADDSRIAANHCDNLSCRNFGTSRLDDDKRD